MLKNIYAAFVWIVFSCLTLQAQVFIQNTMYPYNRYMYNPAAAGTQNGTNVTLLGRLQWLGIDGGPRLAAASINTPVPRLQSGVGAYVITDQLGPWSTTGLNVSYAYQFRFRPGDATSPMLSIGVSGGLLQKAIDGTQFRYDNSAGEDPVVPLGKQSALVPNLAAGLYFSLPDAEGNERFFVGISGQDLLEPSLENLLPNGGIGPDSRVSRSFYLMSGYRFDINEDFSLMPTVMARTDGVSYQMDLSALATLKSLVTIGVAHRFFNDSFSGILGFNVTDDLFIGYAYDYTLSRLNANGDLSSHELILSYTFRSAKKRKSGIDNVIKGDPR